MRFWPAAAPVEWRGLVAADLEAKPGAYDVDLAGADAQGASLAGKTRLTVQAKRFETRRLSVGAEFVNPPAARSGAHRQRSEAPRRSLHADDSARVARLVPAAGAGRGDEQLRASDGPQRIAAWPASGSRFPRAPRARRSLAPNAGRVVLAEDLYFSGNTVVLDHGLGMFSLLAHLSRIDVAAGQEVERGDVLGPLARPDASLDRICTGRCDSASSASIRCRWWRSLRA